MDIQKAIDILKRMRISLATATVDGNRMLEPLSIAIDTLQSKADGRLVELPCKVESVVYGIFNGEVHSKTIDRFIINRFTTPSLWVVTSFFFSTQKTERWDMAIGKTLFLTREEAEQELKGEPE